MHNKNFFRGKWSAVKLDSLAAVGFNESGIVTIHENGMRNHTTYNSKEDFTEDFGELLEAFKKAHKGKAIFENSFGVILAERLVEVAVADAADQNQHPEFGIYFTFRSGLREYYRYGDPKSRDEEYDRVAGMMLGLGKA